MATNDGRMPMSHPGSNFQSPPAQSSGQNRHGYHKLRQNAGMLQMMNHQHQNQANVRNYNIMPDFSKSIRIFNGENLGFSRQRIENVESTATLHNWLPAFILETARTHSIGAPLH
ncbi:hypothetical protein JTB14_038487 [Gonioctena quinquepunctata]|nr:hypothetical protein JTB14_038487 [Gonioctena quinquepunctata]